ncbi:MAG: (4-O-methyl)-D-glucuronate---lignin esterase [Sphingomonadales bacterium]|nr:(4-O-methyl)-D-glucuronate---lignin esterase [Sphingomonadales bacterium]
MRFVFLILALAASAALAQPATDRKAATERDHKATLQRLGIAALRPAPAADAADRDAALPPLLVDAAGRPVTGAGQWRARRRELAALLDAQIYGRIPATAPAIRWDFTDQLDREIGGVAVTTRRYLGHAATSGLDSPALAFALTVDLPRNAPPRRLPLVLELGGAEGEGAAPVLARGWGFALLTANTVQADDGAGLREGVIGFAAGRRPRADDEWGVLRAWGWGAGRAFDLLALDPRIDRRRIAIEGAARYGKAALVAMAYDQRFSLGLIGSSGAGGAGLLRRNAGESIESLAGPSRYHWFAPNFLRYAGPRTAADLPIDAHSLIALAAPRPLFIADGSADPRGSWEAVRAAGDVYRLLGVPGLVGDDYPGVNETRAEGRIAFRRHDGGGANAANWPAFLDFAARQWGLSPRR